MNPKSRIHSGSCTRVIAITILVLAWQALFSTAVRGQLVSSGFPIANPHWEILITDWGYADLALDQTAGFEGREYLSGEWAAAALYTGGQNPTNAIWFQPQWFFPDWVSDSDFGVETTVTSTGTNNLTGFTVYRSVITNEDLRIEMLYEMMDTTNGIAQGIAPRSAGGGGASVASDRYVFRQTYKITNISGGTLNNFRFFQFLHGLNTTNSVIDDRAYAGLPLASYRYDNSQRGDSYAFNSLTGETWRFHDTIAWHAMFAPVHWQAGYYGKLGVDSHVIGKPGIGVHLDVETDTLTDVDNFSPPETRWVGGAQRFDFGTLGAGGMLTMDVLLSIRTVSEFAYPPLNIVIHNAQLKTNKFLIDFQDTTANPVVGFILLKSTNLAIPRNLWEQVPIPYFINFPQAGWNQFQAPYDPTVPRCFYSIKAAMQN